MSKNTWIIFAIVCVGIVAGLVFLSREGQLDVSAIDVNKIQAASEKNGQIADHVYGNKESKVILIEYGDYQCPGCGTAAPVLKAVSEKYKDQIAFVFRNFPLYSMHPNALAAATAAEAAGKQGKFWEMHNALYENQSEWNQLSSSDRTDYFVNLATSVGANDTTLRTDFSNKAIKQKIDFDVALGKKIGVSGTPAIYLNGKKLSDQRFSGSKLTSSSEGSYVWSDATAFENLIIKPALKEAGIKVEEKTE